ncbi:DedA family protein [Actinomadura sp. 3N508]|uniref:DedA family protein n=1 Tax=Actinomadura sp. 3N508 TaxID=3375153 RepID=UPI0037B6E413
MSDAILDALLGIMTSPWIYAALFGLALLDALVPVVPSETLIVTAGVFAAHGHTVLPLVIGAAALGAFCGDHASYAVGRFAGGRLERWMRDGARRRAAYEHAQRILAERGGLLLVVARYIPGGRTTATLLMGIVRYPLRSFTSFDVLAVVLWAAYSALIGYLGGAAFQDHPLRGLLLGLGLALAATALVEAGRYLRTRNRRGKDRV